MNSLRSKLGAAALGSALVLGGAAGAYALTGQAGAQDSSTTTAATSTQDSTAPSSSGQNSAPPAGAPGQGQFDPFKGGHVANGITETVLTGDDLTKATAAAEAAVPGGTVQRAETDAEGAAFEVHVTDSSGKQLTVKLDADFKVTSTEDGIR